MILSRVDRDRDRDIGRQSGRLRTEGLLGDVLCHRGPRGAAQQGLAHSSPTRVQSSDDETVIFPSSAFPNIRILTGVCEIWASFLVVFVSGDEATHCCRLRHLWDSRYAA